MEISITDIDRIKPIDRYQNYKIKNQNNNCSTPPLCDYLDELVPEMIRHISLYQACPTFLFGGPHEQFLKWLQAGLSKSVKHKILLLQYLF